MSTHSPADWAEMVALAFGIWGTGSVFYFLLVDADLADFDPRPAARRVLDTDLGARAVVAVFNAKADLRELATDARQYAALSLRAAALSAAAFLALLLPVTGGTR